MAVREFNGTSDFITMAVGGVAISNFAQGNYSIVAVVKPTTISDTKAVTGIQIGTSSLMCSLAYNSTNQVGMVDDANVFAATVNPPTAWSIIAVRKASGNTVVGCSACTLGSSFTHANSAATTGTAGTPNRIDVGCYLGGGFSSFKDMRLATLAIFDTTLTTGNLDTINSAKTTQSIYDFTPIALWDFNQAATSTAVEDLIGTSDQSAITGTTVVNGDDPTDWVFGVSTGVQNQLAWIRA